MSLLKGLMTINNSYHVSSALRNCPSAVRCGLTLKPTQARSEGTKKVPRRRSFLYNVVQYVLPYFRTTLLYSTRTVTCRAYMYICNNVECSRTSQILYHYHIYQCTCTCTTLYTYRLCIMILYTCTDSYPTSLGNCIAGAPISYAKPHASLKTSTRERQRKSSSWSLTQHATSTSPRLRVLVRLTRVSEIPSWGCLLRERITRGVVCSH